MNFKTIFFDRSFWKTAIPLALPIALQNLMAASFSLIDTFMVARLGGTALSAVGMAGQFTWVFNILIFGLASGTGLFVAQYWGVKDKRSIHHTQGMALAIGLCLGTLFCLAGVIFPDEILRIFNKNPEVVQIGASYLKYASLSYPAFALSFVLYTVLRSTENVKLPMYLSIFNAAINAILNYGLIFGKFALPKMNAAGAAVATAISCWLTFCVLLIICLIRKNIVYVSIKKMFSFTKVQFSSFAKKTTPAILNEGMFALGTAALNIILSNTGVDNYAGVTILRTVENLSFVFIVGLCNACSIIVGKSIGKGDIIKANQDTDRFMLIMPIFSILTATVIILLRHPVVNLFTMDGGYSKTAITAALTCMLIYALDMPLRNIPYLTIVGIFRPGGDPKTGMICDVSSLWLISIPLTAILAHFEVPFPILFLCMYLSEDIPKTVLCLYYYLSGSWIRPVTPEGQLALEKLKAHATKKS
ncbi:MAG: MATE family efflux transporter [Ruminococcaceae bacterium]|nr:MATE family efflux transporter [Oscillospiraceae bacterium]